MVAGMESSGSWNGELWYLGGKALVPGMESSGTWNQGFGSGSGSESRRAKMTHKNRKKSRIFMFLSTGCSLLRAEGFSCSLGVLYGGLGISKLQFLIKKIEIKFPTINVFKF